MMKLSDSGKVKKGEKMKRIIILSCIMTFILCGCENRGNEKNLDIATKQYVGNYLFNTDKGDCIEISGKDLVNHKKVNISTVEDGRDIELVIKRAEYGPGFDMNVVWGETGIDLVTYLTEKKSVDEWGGALEDFYYELACYDFDNDGEKEIIVAAGNKKDKLELYVLCLDHDTPDFRNTQILKSINSGSKAYVNEKREICVMDSQGQAVTYSLKERSDTDIKNIMQKVDSRVKTIKDKIKDNFCKDYYDGDVPIFRYFENDNNEQESVTEYGLYYDEQGKLIYADITHYRGALYSIYFYNDELLHTEVGPFSEGELSINGDMADVEAVVKKDHSYTFVQEDISFCLEHAYFLAERQSN